MGNGDGRGGSTLTEEVFFQMYCLCQSLSFPRNFLFVCLFSDVGYGFYLCGLGVFVWVVLRVLVVVEGGGQGL